MTVLQYFSAELLHIGSTCMTRLDCQTVSTCRALNLMKKTSRGRRGGVKTRSRTLDNVNSVAPYTVPSADVSSVQEEKKKTTITVGLLNCQSVVQKALDVHELILEKDLDVVCLTETWFKERGDEVAITELTPAGYSFQHRPRLTHGGGGIALLFKSYLDVKVISQINYQSFENMEFKLTQGKLSVRCMCVYRPPPSKRNKLCVSTFHDEIDKCLSQLVIEHSHVIVLGDFNVHFDNANHPSTKRMIEILQSLDLCQLVHHSTQRKGHTLDWVVIPRHCQRLVSEVTVEDMQVSDHRLITLTTNLSRQRVPTKIIKRRNIRGIDSDLFRSDLLESKLLTDPPADIDGLVNLYNETLSGLLDRHAPVTSKSVPDRPATTWYSEEVQLAKKRRRRAERKWRKSRLEVDRQLYKQARNDVTRCVQTAKTVCIRDELEQASSDPRRVFSIVNRLLGQNTTPTVLPDLSKDQAASTLSAYFDEKISTIRSGFRSSAPDETDTDFSPSRLCIIPPLSNFSTVTQNELKKVILRSHATYSQVDPIPTKIVLEHLDVLLPIITSIINTSLISGVVPKAFKVAVVKPLLKKHNLDPNTPKNFRPVSNLPFISKVLERVVADQLSTHLSTNNLLDKFQSAYRPGHSTETALLRVLNDLLCAVDGGNLVLLLLLDLSAAFDTIDHDLLLLRLQNEVGVTDVAHRWFSSYLYDRSQYVSVGDARSQSTSLMCGVPQGSVLGPILFSVYTTQLGQIIDRYQVCRHHFADDSQLYASFQPDPAAAQSAVHTMQACSVGIKQWMHKNKLKLNDDKSEALLCGSKLSLSKLDITSVHVGDSEIRLSDSVRDLGLFIDSNLSLSSHVSAMVRTCFYYLRLLGKLRSCINQQAANTIAVSLVHSRIDYCNSTLYGLPDTQLKRLQHVQNVAARIVTRAKKTDHIIPILKELHWLPIKFRIQYKLLSLAYSCVAGESPLYLSELIPTYTPARALRSASQSRLCVPGYHDNTNKKQSGARSFKSAAPVLWNSLPASLKSCPSAESFRKRLKTHFFSQF